MNIDSGSRTALKEWIDIASRIGVAILVLTYVVGLFVVNFHLRTFGFTLFTLVHVEYVLAGWVWLFLVAVSVSAIRYVPQATVRIWKTNRGASRVFLVASELVLVLGAVGFLLEVLTNDSEVLMHKKSWLMVVVLWSSGLFFRGLVVTTTKRLLVLSNEANKPAESFFWTMLSPIFAVTLISMYAELVFPNFSQTLGGGELRVVTLVVGADKMPVLKAAGIDFKDEHVSQPVKLVVEFDDSILLQPANTTAAIRVKRDLIEAILYLNATKNK
jgi:hypothetical protein